MYEEVKNRFFADSLTLVFSVTNEFIGGDLINILMRWMTHENR